MSAPPSKWGLRGKKEGQRKYIKERKKEKKRILQKPFFIIQFKLALKPKQKSYENFIRNHDGPRYNRGYQLGPYWSWHAFGFRPECRKYASWHMANG